MTYIEYIDEYTKYYREAENARMQILGNTARRKLKKLLKEYPEAINDENIKNFCMIVTSCIFVGMDLQLQYETQEKERKQERIKRKEEYVANLAYQRGIAKGLEEAKKAEEWAKYPLSGGI